MLWRLSPRDPLTIGATAMALLSVACAAAFFPALAAVRRDPMHVLRTE